MPAAVCSTHVCANGVCPDFTVRTAYVRPTGVCSNWDYQMQTSSQNLYEVWGRY